MTIPVIAERLIASVVLIAAFAALVKSAGYFERWRARKWSAASLLPGGMTIEQPTLLYFWSVGCSQCTPQERQIEQAKAMLANAGKVVTVLKVNALEEQQLAQSMHVRTVPTTVLLDPHGNVAAWNPGLTPWRTIVDQYQTIGEEVSLH